MRNKSFKLVFPISVILAITLIFGLAGNAFAKTSEDSLEVLVSFRQKPGKDEKALIENEGGKVKRTYHIVPTIAASVPKGKLDSLRRHPRIVSVEEDIPVKIIEQTVPWGVERVEAKTVHAKNKGRGVKVAILDTGIDLDHPDLRVAGNVTFVPETLNGDDDNGHGTMVAGIVAALDNSIGVVGVAPEVELYSVKVLNRNGDGVMSLILAGIEWAIDSGMQVINMSFGGILNWAWAVQAALDKAYLSGIVLVAGAGNCGDQNIIYAPARYGSVIAVGATNESNTRASFSGTGSALELVAPGTNILSTRLGGGYGSGSGTSLSTPHVAGVAALLIASGVTSNVKVRHILQASAKDLGTPGRDNWYGYGLLNASAAMKADGNDLGDTVPPTTRIELSGLVGNEGWYRSEVTVKLNAADDQNGTGVAETQYSLDDGKTWLKYHQPFTIANEGINTIQARSRDNAGNIESPVTKPAKIDRTSPVVKISATPSILWPANHKQVMVEVMVTGSANDGVSGVLSYQLSVKDEYGQVEPSIGPYLQKQIQLEAWREGKDLDGRVYTISLIAFDRAGNKATAQTVVVVPHDQRKEVNKDGK